MLLIEVNDKTGVKLFHQVPRELYKGDPNYVAQLKGEIEGIFQPDRNSSFKHGEAIRWILCDDDGGLIGRIAAFVDRKKMKNSSPPSGGIGFFECIDNQDAANVLFRAGSDWLSEKGCEAMDGSVNFGENFVHWGVLIEGFMKQAYGMPYNKPYYKGLFEGFGFQEYFQQLSYHVDMTKPLPERMVKFAEYLETRPGYTFEPFSRKNIGKYASDFASVLNATWGDYMEDFTPVTDQEIIQIFKTAKTILVDDFIWFAYKDGTPIAVTVAFPDVNQLLVHFDGGLNIFQALRFLYLKRRKIITRNRVLLAGVVPEFQNTGVIAAMFLQFVRAMKRRPEYTEMELSWVGDYNPRMRKIYEQIGGVHMKTHATFRYLFDPTKPFERFVNEKGNSQLRKDVTKKQ